MDNPGENLTEGTTYLGRLSYTPLIVDLYLNDKTGSSYFSLKTSDGKIPYIRIGILDNSPDDIKGLLLHEILEASFTMNFCRFARTFRTTSDNGDYCFFCDHTQFSEISSWAAMLYNQAIKLLDNYLEKKDDEAKDAA